MDRTGASGGEPWGTGLGGGSVKQNLPGKRTFPFQGKGRSGRGVEAITRQKKEKGVTARETTKGKSWVGPGGKRTCPIEVKTTHGQTMCPILKCLGPDPPMKKQFFSTTRSPSVSVKLSWCPALK